MKERRKSVWGAASVLFLLAAIIILFQWYSIQNNQRMVERNKNYAADAASLKAAQIDDELSNALNLIRTYTYFVGESLSEPVVTVEMLQEIEAHSIFDAVIYTAMDGTDYASDGRIAHVSEREFFVNGKSGGSGIEVIFDSNFFDETMVNFYAPVYYQEEIIGVLRGAYLAEEYLQEMLFTTYFGESADVFLCMADQRVIASSEIGRAHV